MRVTTFSDLRESGNIGTVLEKVSCTYYSTKLPLPPNCGTNSQFKNIWSLFQLQQEQTKSQTELKKSPKDTSVIYKERNSNGDQFIKSLTSNISLQLKDILQESKDNNNQKSDLTGKWKVNNSLSFLWKLAPADQECHTTGRQTFMCSHTQMIV